MSLRLSGRPQIGFWRWISLCMYVVSDVVPGGDLSLSLSLSIYIYIYIYILWCQLFTSQIRAAIFHLPQAFAFCLFAFLIRI